MARCSNVARPFMQLALHRQTYHPVLNRGCRSIDADIKGSGRLYDVAVRLEWNFWRDNTDIFSPVGFGGPKSPRASKQSPAMTRCSILDWCHWL